MALVLGYMTHMAGAQTTGQIAVGISRKAMTICGWLEKLESIGCIRQAPNVSRDARQKHCACWVATGIKMSPFIRSPSTKPPVFGKALPECKRIIGPARQIGMVRADPLMVALYGAA